jgi:CubicO group peptidase (beta-lactamase class C family)
MGRRGLLWTLVLVGCVRAPSDNSHSAAVERIGTSLRPLVVVANSPPVTYRLTDRMAHYHTPGISIAVVDSGRLVWARGFGVKETGTTDSVTDTTMFQAASISKPVSATAMLRLVDEGKLNLDQDVNAYLTSWKVPDSPFTAQHKVTLRRLASHAAGLTVHGFPGYKPSDSIPSVPQILDGAKPANTAPVRVDTVPGSRWRYSGGGTTVMQLAMMDVTGEPFAAILKRLVLDPAAMTHSTYEQPLPAALRRNAATAHERDGSVTPGKWHVYPEQAAAGLWTTPTDLLKWAMAITASRKGTEGSLLSKGITHQMLTVQKEPAGLGPMLAGKGKAFRFSHGGANQGFRCEMLYFPETGQGAAVMTNGDQGGELATEVLFAIAAEYSWPDYGPRQITPLVVDGTAMDRVVGTYSVRQEGFGEVSLVVTREGTKLFGEVKPFVERSELVFLEAIKLIGVANGMEFTLEPAADGRIGVVELGGIRLTRKEK